MKIFDIANFHLIQEYERAKNKKNLRFVHYTSADTAKRILETECIWMRNATLMNDYSEMELGGECVVNYFNAESESGKRFWGILENVFEGISDEIFAEYDKWLNDLRWNTYVTSVSIHNDSEESHGRLSMWRAYGGNAGVALVLNPEVLFMEDSKLGAYTYPVHYWDKKQVVEEFDKIVKLFEGNLSVIHATDREDLKYWILDMFHTFAFSLKHPGFAEEQEWRIVYHPNKESSNAIGTSVESINGTPQIIYKLPLKEEFNTGIGQILNKAIIGSSQNSWEISNAFIHVLTNSGVVDIAEKIIVSGIPLRSNK